MKALVLSGGGSHGAYQVGVLKRLMGELSTKYDIFAGVSAGALNAVSLAQYRAGEERAAVTAAEDLWLNIRNSDVKKFFFPPVISALWKSGIYSTEPLRKLLEENVDVKRLAESGKILRVSSVSLNSGEASIWTEKDQDILDGVMASSAFPGVLQARKARKQLWTDGGVRTVTPLKEAIDAGADEVDVILAFKPGVDKMKGRFTTAEVLLRALDVMMNEVVVNDLKVCALKNNIDGYKKIKLNIYQPSIKPFGDHLDFNQTDIAKNIELGYKDAMFRSTI